MPTIFRYFLVRLRGQIIGWGLVFLLIGWPLVSVYDMMLKEKANLEKMMERFKPFITAMVPKNLQATKFDSPDTFLSMRYFTLMPLILGFFAVIHGSGLLAVDEENGTLDLVLAHPVSRTGLFLGRVLALVAATALLLAVAWVGLVIPMSGTALQEKVSLAQIILPFVSLFALLLFFSTLALASSMVLPSRRLAAMVAGFVLLASFFLTSFARANPDLAIFAQLSPLDYYQSGEAINGLNWAWLSVLLVPAGLFTGLAWWQFEHRDIRVAGEGSWRWTWFRRPAAG
jgi:ABC-2 type transport system permease protein